MNAASTSPTQKVTFGNSQPITFGQVAAQTKTFSRRSSLPASFGKYDSFYLSLRSSGAETRQKQWLRRHQYRGDEKVKHGAGSSRRRMSERHERKYPTVLFASSGKMEDVYEDDDIEAERGCAGAADGTNCAMDSTIADAQSCSDVQKDDSQDIVTQQTMEGQQSSDQPTQVSPYELARVDLNPKISSSTPDHNPHLSSRKHKLSPMELDDAFLNLTIETISNPITPEASSRINNWNMTTPVKEDVSTLSSSVEPVIDSYSSSLSSLNVPLESAVTEQNVTSVRFDANVFYPSSSKAICKETNEKQKRSPEITQQCGLTPLSRAIIDRRKSAESTSVCNNHFGRTPPSKTVTNRRGQSIGSATMAQKPLNLPNASVTPKRKPRGAVTSSSKRRRRGSASTVVSAAPAPRRLYNGKAIERIGNVQKCNDKHCRWNPSLHNLKAACERCWTLASEAERKSFIDNGGRHLRINLVKGGCPASCKLFSHRAKVTGVGGCDDEDIRLCRKCFDDMHHVGVRKADM